MLAGMRAAASSSALDFRGRAVSVRVLIADDQSLVRAGFRLVLENHPDLEVVGEASNGHEAIYSAERLEPDVVLMDIRMPELDGIAATREITARYPARVLVLTTYDLDEYVYDALRAGASGFLLKELVELRWARRGGAGRCGRTPRSAGG
jgi:DNA-binding NarL/FixJ family response regulator